MDDKTLETSLRVSIVNGTKRYNEKMKELVVENVQIIKVKILDIFKELMIPPFTTITFTADYSHFPAVYSLEVSSCAKIIETPFILHATELDSNMVSYAQTAVCSHVINWLTENGFKRNGNVTLDRNATLFMQIGNI